MKIKRFDKPEGIGLKEVPGFNGIWINQEGVVYDEHLRRCPKICYPNLNYADRFYPTVTIWNENKKIRKNARVHRLMALAWVKNPNPKKYDMVNHIDSDKFNFVPGNLEWTDASGNMRHAMEARRKLCFLGKAKNLETGKIYTFIRLEALSAQTGLSPNGISASLQLAHFGIYKDIWEIKLPNEKGKRQYFTAKEPLNRHVIFNDKEKIVEKNLINILKPLGIPTYHKDNYVKVAELVKEKGYTYYNTVRKLPPVIVKNLETDEEKLYSSTTAVAKDLKIDNDAVKAMVKSKGERAYIKYIARFQTREPWPCRQDIKDKHKKVISIQDDGKVLEFKNLTAASSHYGISVNTVTYFLKKKMGSSRSPKAKASFYYEGNVPK